MSEGHDPRARRLFVHFGVHKTGSSSIQESLFAGRDRLDGLDYLTDGTRANSSIWVRNAFASDVRRSAVVGVEDNRDRDREDARRVLTDMCSSGTTRRRAVLSAEEIAHLDPEPLAQMHGFLADRWPEITYVGYIREPVAFMRSVFQQRLKKSGRYGFPFVERKTMKLNYHRVVQRLDALVGRDTVQVYPFEREVFPGGDVVRHFLGVVGVSDPDFPVRHVNEGLSATALKALYCYRKLRVRDDHEIGHDASRKHFVAAVTAIDGPPFVLDASLEARILRDNAHILEWAEERMGRRLNVPPATPDGQGARSESDLLRFTDQEMDELARWASGRGLREPARTAGAEGVADLLADLRLRMAGARAISPDLAADSGSPAPR